MLFKSGAPGRAIVGTSARILHDPELVLVAMFVRQNAATHERFSFPADFPADEPSYPLFFLELAFHVP